MKTFISVLILLLFLAGFVTGWWASGTPWDWNMVNPPVHSYRSNDGGAVYVYKHIDKNGNIIYLYNCSDSDAQ